MNTFRKLQLLFVTCVTSCSLSSPSSTVNLTAQTIATPTLSAPITTATPLKETLAPASTNASLTPSAVKSTELSVSSRCVEQDVSLSELGLGSNTRLIVKPANDPTETSWALIGQDQTPRFIAHSTFEGQPLQFASVSPNQKWFIFFGLRKGDAIANLWISSIDGKKQWSLSKAENFHSVYWANDQSIFVMTRPDRHQLWYQTYLRLDPFTKQIAPTPTIHLATDTFAFSPDASKIIHVGSFPYIWYLFDFEAKTEKQIFPWMDISPKRVQVPEQIYLSVNWIASGVSVAYLNFNSIEIATNISADKLDRGDTYIQKLIFPDTRQREEDNHWDLLKWLKDNKSFALWRNGKFYIVDIATSTLYDYCLFEIPVSYFFLSADGRFLAWQSGFEGAKRQGTFVLEIATGRRSWIPNWRILGWGEIEN